MSARTCFLLLVALVASGCDEGNPTRPQEPEICAGFAAWDSSEYVLPYPVGASYAVNQGNCSGLGHSGFWKLGYDFDMPIGTLVTAARAGVMLHSLGDARDGDRERTNLVTVQHVDGTVALYSHLTHNGALVEVGQHVDAGDEIGLSGDTGNTGGFRHLHFSLHPCGSLPGLPGGGDGCPTIAVNFRNTAPNPQGLIAGQAYRALPF